MNDGAPLFARGSRVVVNLDLRSQLAGTVIGTLLDFDGKEYVGLVNDLGNPHLEPVEQLMTLEHRPVGNHWYLFDPNAGFHYSIERDELKYQIWIARVREFPMMWHEGMTPEQSIQRLRAAVRESVEYRDAHPEDPGRFRP